MDPFTHKSPVNSPPSPSPVASVNNPPPLPQPQTPPPSAPQPVARPSFGLPKDRSALTQTAIYVMVLIVGMLGVFFWQNNQLKASQKELSAAQAALSPNEAGSIDKGKYQAVFLVGGQVYFGKIDSLNTQFLTLSSIYYINSPSTSQTTPGTKVPTPASTNTSLIKLGCEIHGPDDKMVIERSQVSYWENLKDESQIVKAITEYVKQTPNGQKCS